MVAAICNIAVEYENSAFTLALDQGSKTEEINLKKEKSRIVSTWIEENILKRFAWMTERKTMLIRQYLLLLGKRLPQTARQTPVSTFLENKRNKIDGIFDL